MSIRTVIPDRVFAVLFAITIGRYISLLAAMIALYIGVSDPMPATFDALLFVIAYLVLGFAFVHLARWDLKRRRRSSEAST